MRPRTLLALGACVLLACSDRPTTPEAPRAVPEDMRLWFAERGIQLPANPPMEPSAKAASDGAILGDGSGNGRVTYYDLWGLWEWLKGKKWFALRFDMDLLDIDRDGEPEWTDLAHLGEFLYGSGENTFRIGEPLVPVTASLHPDPATVDFTADGEEWHRFTVTVTGTDSVQIVVNNLEIHKGSTAPSRSYCPPEEGDTKTVGDGDVIWLAGCGAGTTGIVFSGGSDDSLPTYHVTVDPVITDPFDIELVFPDDAFTPTQQSFVRRAADRWESVIIEGLPDHETVFNSRDVDWYGDWTDSFFEISVDETIDDIRIYVGRVAPGNSVYASGGALWVRPGSSLPVLGEVSISEAVLGLPEDLMEDVFLHEIAHALGFGTVWEDLDLLGNPSKEDPDADTYFKGPLALAAFNSAGGLRYQKGMKVPVENGGNDGHWRQSVFGSELMDFQFDSFEVPLSAITIQSMADIGYRVDLGQAEEYTLPPSAKPAGEPMGHGRCRAKHPPRHR